jgi:hypothetical protein
MTSFTLVSLNFSWLKEWLQHRLHINCSILVSKFALYLNKNQRGVLFLQDQVTIKPLDLDLEIFKNAGFRLE